MTFTTACSDSPSKLKVASPVLPSTGGGVAAARVLITWPVPRLMTARLSRTCSPPLPVPTASGSAISPAGARLISTASGLRWTVGPVGVTQPASSTARAIVDETRKEKFIADCALRSFVLCGCGFGLGAHLRPPRLDSLADRLDLLFLGQLAGVGAGDGGG